MLHCKNTREGIAGRFFSQNENSEFTPCHRTQGDTEFRYSIIENNLRILTKGKTDNRWDAFYGVPWYYFVNKYLKASEHLYLFR